MAIVKRATTSDWNRVGMHLVDPSKAKIAEAKEEADGKGFGIVWVYRKNSSKAITRRMKGGR